MYLVLIVGIFFLLWLFSINSGWSEIAEKYSTKKPPPTFLLMNQKGFFENSFTTGNLNIGVSECGFYLSCFPLSQ